MNSEVEVELLQPQYEEEEEHESRNDMQNDLNPKHCLKKSFEILKSAVKIFTSNPKFMILMILSILPLFVFMVFFEVKLSENINSVSKFLKPQPPLQFTYVLSEDGENEVKVYDDDWNSIMETREQILLELLLPFLFYLFLYPFLEFLSMSLTLKIAAKVHAAEKPENLSLREMLQQKVNFKGPLITYLCVHFLSTMTLLGLLWIVLNHLLVLSRFDDYNSIELWLNVLSITFHSVVFLGWLYKYLEWSAFWNMSMVISVIEEQTGIEAFGMSDYYGKHCKKIGFQLMLGFFVFGNVLRLPCLYTGICDGRSAAGVLITSAVIMMVLFGNLVKWVAILLYFYYCKQQIMEKKVDDHKPEKTVNAADLP